MSKDTPTTKRVTIARTRRIDISDRIAAEPSEQPLTDLPADLVAAVEAGAITLAGAHRRAANRERVRARSTVVLWASYGGELACTAHLGATAAAALEETPNATVLHGATETWHWLTEAEAEQFQALVGVPAACERCGVQWGAVL